MVREIMESHRQQRSHHEDAGIQAEAWTALWKADELRSLNIDSMDVRVQAGEVWIIGHVVKAYHRRLAENLVRAVPGVKAVHNELVIDSDLVIAVAQALAVDARTRSYIIPVGASHGWVQLGGEVPTLEVRQAAQEIAASVATVRGVLTLPHLRGKTDPTCVEAGGRNCVAQPQIGDRVYTRDGRVGRVAEVMIDPQNRLVSHIAVEADYELSGRRFSGKIVVPATAIEVASDESLSLCDNLGDLARRPAYREADFPLAPSQWRPPYPYEPGRVRWPVKRSE